MANPVFGEARVMLSDGRELTVRRDMRAMAEAEEAYGQRVDVLLENLRQSQERGTPFLKPMAALVFGALRAHHSELSLDDAYNLLATDMEALSEAMGRAGNTGGPQTSANPPKAVKAGTGTGFSSRGAKKGSIPTASGGKARAR